jgi:teichuronic acid biosynthesis glycosyltransferase TuaC
MRVLHVTNMYPTPERKDLGIFVKSQVDSLTARGVENDVVEVRGYVSRWNYVRGRKDVQNALRSKQYDLIHVHYGLTAIATFSIRSLPVVISYCGSDLMHPAQRPVSKLFARSTRYHIVESDILRRYLGESSAAVIPSGVDLRIFHPMNRLEAREKLGFPTKDPIVVFVANPRNTIKNFSLAHNVVEKVKQSSSSVKLVVVQGKSPVEVAMHLNAADVLLLTSHWEGSPNVVKEALACALPVVSTDVGDVRERLDGVTHSYVLPPVVDQFAERLQHLIQTPVRSNGPEKIKEVSLERIAERLELFYKEMLVSYSS